MGGMNTFDKHQVAIAKKTLQYSDVGAVIMGGMTKDEARRVLAKHGVKVDEAGGMTPAVKKSELVDCLRTLVKRIEETPFDRNEGLKGPMVAEAKALLERVNNASR